MRMAQKDHIAWGNCRSSERAVQARSAEHRLGEVRPGSLVFVFIVLFAPGPVEAEVCIVFGLTSDGVAVGKKQLIFFVPVKFVITAEINQRGCPSLGRGIAFRTVEKGFSAERPFLSEIALHEPAGERIVAVARDFAAIDDFSAASIAGPWPPALLNP